MKIFTHTLITVLFFSLTASASAQIPTYEQKNHGHDERSVTYVNDKAKEFIEDYNKQHNTHWQTVETDTKQILSKCAIPLKAKWHKIIMVEGSKRVVSVYCDKTVDDIPSKWHVHIPVFKNK